MSTPLSLIIPAYNEAERLPSTLQSLQKYRREHSGPAECIVVDDGSGDATAEVVAGFAAGEPWCRLHRLDAHAGKGAAVRSGMLEAVCDQAFFTDADLSTSLANLVPASRLLDSDVDLVLGSRTHPDAKIVRPQPFTRRLAARLGNRLIRSAVALPYLDTQCGFKGFRLGAAKRLFEGMTVTGFMFDVEILVHARRAGMSIAEFPVEWADRPGGQFSLGSNVIGILSELRRIRRAARNG